MQQDTRAKATTMICVDGKRNISLMMFLPLSLPHVSMVSPMQRVLACSAYATASETLAEEWPETKTERSTHERRISATDGRDTAQMNSDCFMWWRKVISMRSSRVWDSAPT